MRVVVQDASAMRGRCHQRCHKAGGKSCRALWRFNPGLATPLLASNRTDLAAEQYGERAATCSGRRGPGESREGGSGLLSGEFCGPRLQTFAQAQLGTETTGRQPPAAYGRRRRRRCCLPTRLAPQHPRVLQAQPQQQKMLLLQVSETEWAVVMMDPQTEQVRELQIDAATAKLVEEGKLTPEQLTAMLAAQQQEGGGGGSGGGGGGDAGAAS